MDFHKTLPKTSKMALDPQSAASSPPESRFEGTQLGDYQLQRCLGQGATAEVYLARQASLNRPVAVKILKDELVDDETYVKRFRREAEAAAALVHANIVQIYEVGSVERVNYIAQEFVEGENLRRWIERNGRADLPEALSILGQVTAALVKAAERNIVHRDIKPENILLTRSGEVKVADFGLAQIPQAADRIDLTQFGVTMGTPLYMSPEQIEGHPLDPRSDLYSLGVMAYYLLAGEPPFSGQTALGIAVQHLKKEPTPLSVHRGDLPEAFCRLIDRLLAKSPEDRPASAAELLKSLRQIQRETYGETWPEVVSDWTDSIIVEVSASGVASDVTRQLQAVLDESGTKRRGGSKWLRMAGYLFLSFLVGSILAWSLARSGRFFTPASPQEGKIERLDTPQAQSIQAARMSTPEAWQAVVDYFPQRQLFVRRARVQLARLYLNERDFRRASDEFHALLRQTPEDQSMQAFSLAGLTVIAALENKPDEARKHYEKLLPIRDKLQDAEVGNWVDRVMTSFPDAKRPSP